MEKAFLLRPYGDDSQDYVLEIDNSSLEYFNTCARSAEYQLVHKRGFGGSPATDYGGAIHAFLDRHICGLDFDRNCVAMAEDFANHPPKDADEWRTLDHALTAMEGYIAFYKQDNRFRPATKTPGANDVLCEIPFRIPLTIIDVNMTTGYPASMLIKGGDDKPLHIARLHVYWTGRIDLLGYNHLTGEPEKPAVMDHKTTSMAGPTFFKEFELSQQVIGYLWAARCLALEGEIPADFATVDTFILDAIVGRRPTRTGVQNEYLRHTYTYTNEQIDEWQTNVNHLIADFMSHLVRGFFPMQTKQCVGKYGVCAFHPVCTLPSALRLQHLHAAYAPITWSPLNQPQTTTK